MGCDHQSVQSGPVMKKDSIDTLHQNCQPLKQKELCPQLNAK